jgi:electron transfer flavoprotein beta subunit
MKIVVLVKQVPDTWEERKLDPATGNLDRSSGEEVLDEINERALEIALAKKDSERDTEVVVLAMGPANASQALRKALSMGADSAVHIHDDRLAGSDLASTARVIAAALRSTGFDLVIAGNESTDGRGGVIPAMVAEHLGLPVLTALDTIEISADRVAGRSATMGGTTDAHVFLPAVVSVTEKVAEPRFPTFRGIMTAKKKQVAVISLDELEIDQAAAGSGRSVVLSTVARPARQAGLKIVDDGTAATQLADYLIARRLA